MTISPIVSYTEEDYLHREIHNKAGLSGPEDTPMLFIFNRQNSIQIAWNGKLPTNRPETRMQQLDTRFGTVGFIRTYSVG